MNSEPHLEYVKSEADVAMIERTFSYHAPLEHQIPRYEALRGKGKELAHVIASYTPKSREQSLAITHLQQAIMFANAAIAINEGALVRPVQGV